MNAFPLLTVFIDEFVASVSPYFKTVIRNCRKIFGVTRSFYISRSIKNPIEFSRGFMAYHGQGTI